MSNTVLLLNGIAAVFAVMFIVLYLRIIIRAEEIGPAPISWILFAVGSALIVAYAVLEAVYGITDINLLFHVQKVYFMIGNMVLFGVLFRIWRSMGADNDR